MSRNRKRKEQLEPEIAAGLLLQDIAYGGESVARLPKVAVSEMAQSYTAEEAEEIGIETQLEQISDDEEPTVSPSAESYDEAAAPPLPQSEKNEVVFVAGGIPGETVDVQLYRRKKSYLRGNVIRIVEPSPDRQDAPCPYFGVEKWPNCGGCQWQHTDYQRQLAFKAKILRDQFERIGGLANPPLLDPVPALSIWGYRNNVEFQVDRVTGELCYHRQNSIRLVPVQSCHIAHPLINIAIEPLNQALQKHLIGKVHQVTVRVGPVSNTQPVSAEEISAIAPYNPDETARAAALERFFAQSPLELSLQREQPTIMFILRMLAPADLKDFVADMQAALDPYVDSIIITEGKKRKLEVWSGQLYTLEILNDVKYRVPPLAFFQSNSPMAQVLVNEAMSAFEVAGLDLKKSRVLDVYCGVGTFGLQLAQRGARVLGVEEYEGAIEAARENARLNLLEKQTEWVAAKAEEYILQLAEQGEHFDAILVDPPRRGCDPALLNSLLETRPGFIVYVSCDPSTLARDIKILGATYELIQSRAVDMFPETYHMESVSLLRLKK